MDEQEWVACDEPEKMLLFLLKRGAASERKCRLFACAWCRTQAHRLVDEGLRAIAVSELYADGLAGEAEVRVERDAAKRPDLTTGNAWYVRDAEVQRALRMAVMVAWGKANSKRAIRQVAEHIHQTCDLGDRRTAVQWASLVRDVFGNPFRPPRPIAPCVFQRHEGTVKHLAEAAYEERMLPEGTLDPHRLAVLADALEKAGCTDEDTLGHLRQQGAIHVRGCWVVDLLLAKE